MAVATPRDEHLPGRLKEHRLELSHVLRMCLLGMRETNMPPLTTPTMAILFMIVLFAATMGIPHLFLRKHHPPKVNVLLHRAGGIVTIRQTVTLES